MSTSVFLFLGSFKISPKGHPSIVRRDQQQNLEKRPVHQQNKPEGLCADVRFKQAAEHKSGVKGGEQNTLETQQRKSFKRCLNTELLGTNSNNQTRHHWLVKGASVKGLEANLKLWVGEAESWAKPTLGPICHFFKPKRNWCKYFNYKEVKKLFLIRLVDVRAGFSICSWGCGPTPDS